MFADIPSHVAALLKATFTRRCRTTSISVFSVDDEK